MNNPWLGLSSYSEDSLKYYQFNGRTAAIASLTSLIRRNLFVTLYGRSGIGKTSLLQAGVFPVLRNEGFIPFSIRLNDLKTGDNATESIWNKLCETLQREGYTYIFCDDKDEYKADFNDILVLRKLFSAGKFLNNQGIETIPVIVIDQFEEILYRNSAASRTLISQLYALIDDNYNLRITHRNWHDDTNFRIIISIREDDLFLFEDYIDSLNCTDFKSNRYRLLPLSDKEAKEVVLNPVANMSIFDTGKEVSIAETIVLLSKNGGQHINTLLLSLICHVLYNNCITHSKLITLADLEGYNDIIESYYIELTKNLPKEQRYWLEDHLIDNQGRRTSVYVSDIEKFAPQAKHLIGNSTHRLLNENQGRIEFIHDQLATSVMKIRSNRKKNETKRIGIITLVILLIGLFFYSFSHTADFLDTDFYKNANNLIGDIETTSININLDSLNVSYTIDNCPSLKSINIEGRNGTVSIYNCPSLVNITYSKDYVGNICILNCPNINKYDKKVRQYDVYDTLSYEKYTSQYPAFNSNNSKQFYNNFYFSYDSLSNTLIVNRRPIIVKNGNKYKIATWLPDSIKRITDCRVLYGQKDYYSRLIEYQSFKSINELPIYYTWELNFDGMISFLKAERLWLCLSIIGLIFIQFIFWVVGYNNLKIRIKGKLSLACSAFIYGIGMSILAAISFMACYWTIFNIVFPFNQTISLIVGVIGCICCMSIVYKNAFYSLYSYIKSNGIRGLALDFKESIKSIPRQTTQSFRKTINNAKRIPYIIKKHYKLTISVPLMIALVTIGVLYYFNEKSKREGYISQINAIIEHGEYARAYTIIEGLEQQKTSFLYPIFQKKLLNAKNRISGDSIFLVQRITPQYVKNLAKENESVPNIMAFSELLAISKDATKFAICVKFPKSNDLQSDSCQAILLDITNRSLHALTPKSTSWHYDFKCAISPSCKTIVTTVGSKRYLYQTYENSSIEISDGFYNDVEDIIMNNDSVYYFTYLGTLYKAFVDNRKAPTEINKSEKMWYNLNMISDDVIGATGNWSEIIIYNTFEDSVYFHSKQRNIGELRNINRDYAITTKGLFDIKRDTLISENRYYYEYKGDVVELQKKQGQYSFVDLNGKDIVTITTEDGDYLNNLIFSGDGNSIIDYQSNCISIYSVSPIANRNWMLSDSDKRIFGLK